MIFTDSAGAFSVVVVGDIFDVAAPFIVQYLPPIPSLRYFSSVVVFVAMTFLSWSSAGSRLHPVEAEGRTARKY